jgi:hypothetical protein
MNIDLKKINWEPGKEPTQIQLMTLRIRKKSDEDEEGSYTTIADNMQVYTDGTILNPPVIKDLDEETNYVLRVLNNDPAGGKFDMVFTTPATFETEAITKSYYPDSELTYDKSGGFRTAMLPPGFGAYYSLEYTPADWFGARHDAILPDNVVWEKKEDLPGIKLQTATDYVQIPMDNAFLDAIKNRYALGVHFYVAAEDLPATGMWPLIAFGSPPSGDGILVYVNCDTKKIHWRQQRNAVEEEIISVNTINTNAWNQVFIFRATNPADSQLWLNSSNTFTGAITAASIPDIPFLFSGVYIGSAGGIFSKFYFTTLNIDSAIALKYQQPPYPVGILENYDDSSDKYRILRKNMIVIDNNKIIYTLPSDVPAGRKLFYIEDSDGISAAEDITVLPIEKKQSPVEIDFAADSEAPSLFKDFCYPMAKGWGGANGGVSPKHIYVQDGLLVLEAHGDQYDGHSQGFSEDGTPKVHDIPEDPSHNIPWTTRVGAAITSREYYGYGSYVVEAKLPRDIGVAPSFWTAHYAKVHPQDPRYEQLLAQGLHSQNTRGEGDYVVSKNEIDMQLPANNANYIFGSLQEMLQVNYTTTWVGQKVAVAEDENTENNGTWQLNNIAAPNQAGSWTKINNEIQRLYRPQKNNIRCINWRGELGEGNGLTFGGYPLEDEYFSMFTGIGKDVWDEAFHEFRFDWYANRVEYYVDGVMVQVNRSFVPDIPGRWTIGLWFPSEPDRRRPWLVNPDEAWAGPVADWKYQKMLIKRMAHTPFSDEEAGGTNRLVGETNPFDGLQTFPGPLPG